MTVYLWIKLRMNDLAPVYLSLRQTKVPGKPPYKSKVDKLSDILDVMKSRETYVESNLGEILADREKMKEFPQVAKLLEEVRTALDFYNECDQFSVSILSVRDTEEKVIWKACTTMKAIPNCSNYVFQKVSRYKKSRTEPFFRKGVVKTGTFYQNVRHDANIFTSSHEN